MGDATDPRVRIVLSILDAGWHRPVRLPDLAARAGIGQSRLEHLFKEQVGCCVREYVARRRLEHAARLLLGTRLTVKEISNRVGISDRCNFNHSFKKRFGVSPRAFRSAQICDRPRQPQRVERAMETMAS